MDPVKYTLKIQQFSLIAAAVCFVGVGIGLTSLDPFTSQWAVWAVLTVLFVGLTALMTLLSFWWAFSVKKEILNITEVNQVVYQSLIASALVIFILVLQITRQLNTWLLIMSLTMYAGYQMWLRT
jgi:hypothetical protein